jgi:quercetin dioxygenase-like cupin family protein
MGFVDLDHVPVIRPIPGVQTQTPHGQHLMLSRLHLDAGAEVPLHQHPHEQAGILLEGRMELTIGDQTRVLDPGALYIIPPNVPHRAVAVDGPVLVLDVFSPIREDYAAMSQG